MCLAVVWLVKFLVRGIEGQLQPEPKQRRTVGVAETCYVFLELEAQLFFKSKLRKNALVPRDA